MKNTNIQLKIGALALMAGLYSTGAVADTKDGNASANLITPLTIGAVTPMVFGNIAAGGTSAGTIEMTDAGVRSFTGGASTVGIAVAGTPLSFPITGEAASLVDVGFSVGILDDGSGNTMDLTMNAVPAVTLVGGTATVTVGGSLAVTAGLPAGPYSTTTGGTAVIITVNYQ